MPAGPLASQPLASYIASCELTQRLLHSGVTRFQNWLRFQNVFQNASQPSMTSSEGSATVCTLPSVETHWPFTSLHVLRLQIARYMLL